MRKLTTEQFIEKAQKIHGSKYDYSKVKYINAQEKVCIICPKHGEFWQKPYNHLNGNGCAECNRTTWTTEKFILKAKEVHGDKYDYSKTIFKNTREKVCIICNDLDRNGKRIGEFWQYPLEHLSGRKYEREKRGIKEQCWETRVCPICGKEFKERKKYEKITCSEECRREYIEKHKDEINQKRSDSLKRSFSLKSKEEIKKEHDKARETCLKRYGKTNFSQTEKGRKISSETLKKYKHIRDEKYKNEVLIPKYKSICEDDNLELIKFRDRFDCDVKCKKCGNIFNVKTLGYLKDSTTKKLCRDCYPIEQITGPTKMEIEFYTFLNELSVNYKKNCRSIITPNEIDFYLPEYNIGFELNGLYWHSEAQKPNKNYHLEKTIRCKEKGVRLIHIFEDEWMYKQDIVKSRIKNILHKIEEKIYARKCIIKELDKKTTNEFIEKNHIQGNTVFKYSYGLYHNNELVSVMTFGKLRKNLGRDAKDGCYELIRFCNKLNTTVIGGASKLLKYFIQTKMPQQIISYADKRWSEGALYETLGFDLLRESAPNYFYVIGNKRYNRFGFRKSELVKKYHCPKEKTEREFCLEKRWYRIYDCGTKVYGINLDNRSE